MASTLIVVLSFFASRVVSDIPNNISIPTECKKCPFGQCSNVAIYDSNKPSMNLTCWTEGQEVVDDTTWLKTNDNCYVTQYDLEEYAGDYTTDLPYCGRITPEWSSTSARTRYYSDCFITPYIYYSAIKHYKNDINLELTCLSKNRTGSRGEVLGRRNWYKTSSNCYVHETTLWPVQDQDELDDCGPIYERLNAADHAKPAPTPIPSSSSLALAASFPTPSAPAKRATPHSPDLHRRFLYQTFIDPDYVNCTSSSNATDRAHGIERVYFYNQTVTLQCGTYSNGNGEIMLYTTDFCWIKDAETSPTLQESFVRMEAFGHCEEYVAVS